MIISLLRSISNQSVFSDTPYFTSEPSFTLVKGNLTMNRNPVLNSPDDITEDLLKRIINNDLDSLTINYEFAYTYPIRTMMRSNLKKTGANLSRKIRSSWQTGSRLCAG